MTAALEEPRTLYVRDPVHQKHVRVPDVPPDVSISELIRGTRDQLALPKTSSSGAPVFYRMRLDREGRHLNGGERVGEALKPDDQLTMVRSVDAGGWFYG